MVGLIDRYNTLYFVQEQQWVSTHLRSARYGLWRRLSEQATRPPSTGTQMP